MKAPNDPTYSIRQKATSTLTLAVKPVRQLAPLKATELHPWPTWLSEFSDLLQVRSGKLAWRPTTERDRGALALISSGHGIFSKHCLSPRRFSI